MHSIGHSKQLFRPFNCHKFFVFHNCQHQKSQLNEHETARANPQQLRKSEQQYLLTSAASMVDKTAYGNILNESTIWHNFKDYYESVSYFREFRNAQDAVTRHKNELYTAMQEKRELIQSIEGIRQKIHSLHQELKFINKRASTDHLDLLKQEYELYTAENELQTKLNIASQREVSLLDEFTRAINDANEKEKLHSNFLKMLAIVGTIFGSIISLALSLMGHWYQSQKISLMQKSVDNGDIQKLLQKIEELQKEVKKSRHSGNAKNHQESWSAYIHRHTSWMYNWALPKK